MFGYIDSFLSNPKEMLIFFLLAFPGRILALSAHEWGHSLMADRCGDPTARMMGRLTLNPFKHLDPVGTLMMLLFGFGWAKPVPVNPRNFRNFRKDDLKVSVAGVAMNLIMFLIGSVLMYAVLILALSRVPTEIGGSLFQSALQGEPRLYILKGEQYYYWPVKELLNSAAYAGDSVIAAVFGSTVGYLYDMLGYFVVTNIALLVFNLLPVPPLDGYHVLNDLFIRRTALFAKPKTAQICTGILMALCLTGMLGKGLSFVINDGIFAGMGALVGRLFHLI